MKYKEEEEEYQLQINYNNHIIKFIIHIQLQLIIILITLDYAQLYFCPEPISGPTRPQLQLLLQQQIQEPPFYNSLSATSRSLLYSTPTHYNYNYIHNYNPPALPPPPTPFYTAYNKIYNSYLGGSTGSQLGAYNYNYTPIGGRNYRYYKYGLGNSSYNGYYSLSYGESYYPAGPAHGIGVGGGGPGSGVGLLGGRLSPAAVHNIPLLATSATTPVPATAADTPLGNSAAAATATNSWLKLPPPPLLPPLDDDLQVNTEPYLSSFRGDSFNTASVSPFDNYLLSPAASLRSDSYAYRRSRRLENNIYRDPYYSRYRSRSRGSFGYYTSTCTGEHERECDFEFDRWHEYRNNSTRRSRANSLQNYPIFRRSPLINTGRLSADCLPTTSPLHLRRQELDRDREYLHTSPRAIIKTSPQRHQQQQQQQQQQHLHPQHNSTATVYDLRQHQQQAVSQFSQTGLSGQAVHERERNRDRYYYNATTTSTTATRSTTATSITSNNGSASALCRQQQHSAGGRYDSSCEDFHFIPPSGHLTCLSRKRMMVSKLWKGCFPDITPEHVHRHNFYLCQWQRNTQVRIVYLFYRWLTAITCLAALVCSLLDIGRTEEHFENHYAKWWIYLTHWALLFCTLQAWLAAWIVTQGMMVEREDFEMMRQAKKSRLHHIYWVLYTCATVYAFVVTMLYWLLVHDPDIHKIDTLNIMVHVLNSVIMLIDLAIVGHPIKLSHVYFTTGIGLAYGIFTGIYFLAGGTDRKNQVAIYPMMDWTKPGKAIIVTVCAIIFVFVVHFICFLLYRARVWLFTKLCIRTPRHDDGDMGEGLHEDVCARLGGGSSADYSHQQQYPIVYSEQPHRSYHTSIAVNNPAMVPPSCTREHLYTTTPIQQQQQHFHGSSSHKQPQQQQQHQYHPAHHQYPPQYAGYQQQPVVAGVNVGVISTAEIYQQQQQQQQQQEESTTKQHTCSAGSAGSISSGGGMIGRAVSTSSLSRTVSHLDASQREQFLNPNKMMEYKM